MEQSRNEVTLIEEGRAGIICLNRPKALNALTLTMIRAIEPFYHRCARASHIYGVILEAEGKAFCAGGDIRGLYTWGMENKLDEAARFYAEEYQHNWTLECFRKPHVALINGVMMGGGIGLSIYGTHRVAGENLRFAMPETAIGFFPDIGGSWFLPRMPGMTGLYLGLTGNSIGPADAYYLGVVTQCIPSERFGEIKAAMIESDPIDLALDTRHENPGPSNLGKLRPIIDRVFSAPSLEHVFRALERETGEWQDWARETLATLYKRSPLSLAVTFEQLRRGRVCRTLKEALIMEYRVGVRMLREPDFYEGVRAVIIDKDQAPKWQARSIGEVDGSFVKSLFEPLPEGDLKLIDYFKVPGT
jgi:enoyl-CoA hydratase